MASNDPTDTGGLFIGRRPGTAPLRYRGTPTPAGRGRRGADRLLAGFLLFVETVLCVSLWGPQPLGWLWFGSQVNYWTGSVTAGITSAFLGMVITLFITLALAKRVDHAWRLVRRAAGYEQKEGALNKIFIISLMIVGTAFVIWFFFIEGPGPSVAPQN
ncbi:MAG: hypothetical protein QOI64_2126 [Solirubrobacteraceae bacterium]|jgi:hypothetical protein|nr:hypothetical protein [Solirubrobacteraceae bacterium]